MVVSGRRATASHRLLLCAVCSLCWAGCLAIGIRPLLLCAGCLLCWVACRATAILGVCRLAIGICLMVRLACFALRWWCRAIGIREGRCLAIEICLRVQLACSWSRWWCRAIGSREDRCLAIEILVGERLLCCGLAIGNLVGGRLAIGIGRRLCVGWLCLLVGYLAIGIQVGELKLCCDQAIGILAGGRLAIGTCYRHPATETQAALDNLAIEIPAGSPLVWYYCLAIGIQAVAVHPATAIRWHLVRLRRHDTGPVAGFRSFYMRGTVGSRTCAM